MHDKGLTKVIGEHFLVFQRLFRSDGHNRFMGTQGTKPFWLALLTTPLDLALENMHHGDNIAETAAGRQTH